MNSRERVLAALNHKQPDRVPMDLGTTNVTSIHIQAYKRLIHYLGLDIEDEPPIVDKMQQLVVPSEAVLKELRIDTRGLWMKRPKNPRGTAFVDGSYRDEWGLVNVMPKGGYYYEVIDFPLKEPNIEDIEKHRWPDPYDSGLTDGLREQAEQFHRKGKYALVAHITGTFEQACLIRGFENFFMDLIVNPDFVRALLDKVLEISIGFADNLLSAVGDYIDIIKFGDDLGTQQGLIISPEHYRNMIKPLHRQLISFIKNHTHAKICHHTCGAVFELIEDILDTGVDILNPIQISAEGMEPHRLNKEFGDRVVFWGGIDTQRVLPKGSPQEVEEEVKRIVRELSLGGGYVIASVHNIQPDVPPENIVAMFEAGYKHGRYPIED